MPAPKEIVNKWVDAFNARDVEAIVSLYHKDAVNHQVANESVAGRDAIREMFTNEFSTAKMVCIVEVEGPAGPAQMWLFPCGKRENPVPAGILG